MDKKKLIETAIEFRNRAYAPYSGFKVGAAVEGASGKIYGGCNIENTSYGLTICAERAAVARAVAEGEREIKSVAVATSDKKLSMPCGACRQVIIEFGKGADIFCTDPEGNFNLYKSGEMLPNYDDQDAFKKHLHKIKESGEEG